MRLGYRGETTSRENASTGVVNFRYDCEFNERIFVRSEGP